MKKLASVFFLSCFFVLLLFFLFGGYEEELARILESRENRNIYWLTSFGILASDIFIPVPSSLVMMMNGKVLGFVWGSLLSTLSGLVSSVVGFFVGKKLERMASAYFGERERKVSNRLFSRFGKSAIIISKALPVLSEAVSFVSGAAAISFRKYLLYSLIGHLIISAVYAYTGSFSSAIDSTFLTGVIIILVLVLFWGMDTYIQRKEASEED